MKLLEGKVAIITFGKWIESRSFLLNRVQMLLYIQFISRICGSFRKELNALRPAKDINLMLLILMKHKLL
jgi:hypothetical protein